MKFTHSGKIGFRSRDVYMYIKESKTAVPKFFSAVVVFVLSFNSGVSIAYSDEPEIETVACSTSGWVTIQDNILVSNDFCFGSVEIPLYVAEIAELAFTNASGLTGITFEPNSALTKIGSRAFQSTGITEITIPASVTSIGSEAFADLADLVRVSFADNSELETIGAGAFKSTGITEVTIPDSTNSIGIEAFANIPGLTFVILDSGSSETEAALTTIGASAFIGSGLTEITIPASVTSIGDLAFANSESLEKVYFLGDAPLVGQDAFLLVSETAEGVVLWTANGFEAGENWNGLQIVIFGSTPCSNSGYVLTVDGEITNNYGCAGDLEIPSDVAAIGPGAFLGADLLETISYADESSLAVIQERAFANTGLTSVSLPATVVYIGDQAFANTSALTSITFDPESTLTTIGFGAFSYSGLVEFTVPSTVTSIGDLAFEHTVDLAAISFDIGSNETGSTLESIGSGAFSSSGLAEVTIPSSVTTIGDLVFANASALTAITFGSEETASTLATIGASAFINSALTSIDLPASVISIGDKAFAYTYDLTIFKFTPNSNLSSIGAGAFNYSGISEITIPASVTTIGDQAFGFTSDLTTFNFAPGSTLETIGPNAFSYSGFTSLTIPASVTTISDQAFLNQSELTSVEFETGSNLATIGVSAFASIGITEIKIPASVTTISDQAFSNTFDLTIFNFAPNSKLESIGANVFSYSGIKEITIPATVTTISDQAFANMRYLKSLGVTSGSDSFVSDSGVLFNSDQTILLKYPLGSEEPPDSNERTYTVPSQVTEIADGAFRGIYKNTVIVFPEDSALEKIGASAFNNAGITEINIPATVTTIGDHAFANASLLTSVTLGAGSILETIGEYAFANTSISSINIPESVTSIGKSAFEDVSTLQTVSLTAGSQLSTIGDNAFYNAFQIASINIPATVTSIGDRAFANATSLATVTIGAESALETIGESAFANTKMASFVIPSGITEINNFTFSGASSLTSIVIPSSVTSIGDGAFEDAYSLTSITIPSSVTSIGNGAFNSTTSLTKFYFLGNAPSGISNFENLAVNATAYKSAAATGFPGTTWRGLKVQLGVFTLTFDAQGGSAVESQTLLFGIPLAAAPVAPTRSGYLFSGWSETATGAVIKFPYSPIKYENKTLYAKWIQKAKVTASKPAISGKAISTAKGINKLTVKPGVWTGIPAPTFAYQWYSCTKQVKAMTPTIPKTCTLIKGQTKTLLPVVTVYKNKFLAAKVTGTSAGTTPTSYLTVSTAKVK